MAAALYLLVLPQLWVVRVGPRAMCSTLLVGLQQSRSSAASAAAAAPTRPVLVLATLGPKPWVVALAAPADASGL